jgi:hypothetical protein
MDAEFLLAEPRLTCASRDRTRASMSTRLLQTHRWTSILFTLTVVVNFAALHRGPIPALITYSPLPPLLILNLSGLTKFASDARAKRHPVVSATKG